MGLVGRNSQQGVGLLSRLWSWASNAVDGGSKSAVEKAAAAEQSFKSQAMDAFNRINPDATPHQQQSYRDFLDANSGGAADGVKKELKEHGVGRKLRTAGIAGLAVWAWRFTHRQHFTVFRYDAMGK